MADRVEQGQFMTFQVAEEEFGIDVMRVQELIRYQKPSRIPNAPKAINGVINFRGHIIPVIDMRRKFNFEPGKYDEFSVIIVLDVKDKIMGLLVDRVLDIVPIVKEDVQGTLDFQREFDAEYLCGVGKVGEQLVFLLDPDELLSQRELGDLEEAHGEFDP
ncbi:MAG: chemotaxis protein CheW [Limnochordia bacterium]|nr:purine-binding chemotaxis protein CheW [Bacillota bacterium]